MLSVTLLPLLVFCVVVYQYQYVCHYFLLFFIIINDRLQVNAVNWSQTRNENLVISSSWDNLIKVVSALAKAHLL